MYENRRTVIELVWSFGGSAALMEQKKQYTENEMFPYVTRVFAFKITALTHGLISGGRIVDLVQTQDPNGS